MAAILSSSSKIRKNRILARMRRAGYRVVPHTAEIGIHIEGRTWVSFFSNAAQGLMALYGCLAEGRRRARRIRLRANDPEELLVRWLNELIFMVSSKYWAPRSIHILGAGENFLDARVSGFDLHMNAALPEIKSATYHKLKVERSRGKWAATVILDV